MLSRIKIEKFKKIESIELDLLGVNVLIGGNNAGKSSALQALQFAVSVLQTLKIEIPKLKFDDNEISKTLSPESIIYSPIKDIYHLIYGKDILSEGAGKEIIVEFYEKDEENSAKIFITKGRNKNISVKYSGASLCRKMAEFDPVFSMYVPGLAGIPFYEESRSIGAVRRAAARGDCNTVLRNVLYHLSKIEDKQKSFLEDLHYLFPKIEIEIDAKLDNDGIIDVFINDDGYKKPIDAAGTGVLQAIQICAYMNYFDPQLLLLDEPDSHLHPNNQNILAQMILRLSKKDKNIIISTHSRHLVSCLRKEAQITLLKEGVKQDGSISEYDILMEIGALDEYDVYRDPKVKYIIATEDDSTESNHLLDLVLISSGFDKESYRILPYKGCSNMPACVYLAQCLNIFRKDLKVIIHRDRDGMSLDEIKEIRSKTQGSNNTYLFVTKHNDLEMYFCSPEYISSVTNISIDDAQVIVDSAIENAGPSGLID